MLSGSVLNCKGEEIMKNKIKNALNSIFGIHSPSKNIPIVDEMAFHHTAPVLSKELKEALYKGTPISPIKMENVHEKSKDEPEEWIWVEGYKGTDKDMKCRDYQFELGKQHDMPEGEKIEECRNGFHLCEKLRQVFSYYDVCDGNRFFKVKALVRKKDYDECRKPSFYIFSYGSMRDKLVSKSIIFTEELTVDEILKVKLNGWVDVDLELWSDESKQIAIDNGVSVAVHKYKTAHLIELGYSEALARFILNNHKYNIACEVAAIPEDISMDVRIAMIFAGCEDD